MLYFYYLSLKTYAKVVNKTQKKKTDVKLF